MYAVSIFKSSLYLNLVIFFHPSIFKFYLLTFFSILLLPPSPPHFFPHTLHILEILIPFQTAQETESLFSPFIDNLSDMFSIIFNV